MKRLVGGDFLLDVSSIELEETSTLTNITDTDVISQLTNLKKFIPNPSMIKPIWVKLHDGNDKLVVARGTLCVIDADEFELDVILNGYTLKIHVKFTQVLNEDDEPIDDWYIATNDAKYLFTTNNFATFKVADVKNIDGEILSQLKCGDIVIKEDASGEHAYIVSYRGETGICLTYADASVVETQSYDLVDDEWVYNSEDKTDIFNPRLESIKDKDGHLRFIEGNITPSQITGITFSYCKWSLSGSHLMLVVAGTLASNTTVASQVLARISNLPQWIYDKLVIIYALIVAKENMPFYTQGGVVNTEPIALKKENNYLDFINSGTITNSSQDAKGFRFTFDFLIDN